MSRKIGSFKPKSKDKYGPIVYLLVFGVIGGVVMLILTFAAPAGGFQTLPVNAPLPSESECASRVRSAPEIRPQNQRPNNTKGIGGNYEVSRISGNYTGTTDEIIQWAACKWGMDEDILRAQMVQESGWFQSSIGDFTSDGSSHCSPVYPTGNYSPQYNGDSQHNNQCPESYGLSQVRWDYHKSAFYRSSNETPTNLTNNAIFSTAYNLDYWGSVWRRCFNGEYTWLNTVDRGQQYAAGDAWGCLGMWFSGRWYTDRAVTYISKVQSNLNNRVWEQSGFANWTPANSIPFPDPDPTPDPDPVCEDSDANNTGGSLPCTYDPDPEPTPDPDPDPEPPAKPGDTTSDNKVNRDDLRVVLYYYGSNVSQYTNGDVNGDSKVNRDDLRVVLYYYEI